MKRQGIDSITGIGRGDTKVERQPRQVASSRDITEGTINYL